MMIVAAFVMFGLGGFLLVGCGGGDVFSKMTVTASSERVNLYLDIDEDGTVNAGASTQTGEVVFTVKGAPKAVNNAVTARSYDNSVATAEVIKSTADGKTRVVITAVTGGRTRIEALTAAGGRTAIVDVAVDIPAKDLNVKTDVNFGVLRGASVKLAGSDFNFFSTVSHASGNYSKPTLNDVRYEVVGAALGVSPAFMPTVSGAVLSVPVGYPYDTVTLRPILSHLEKQAADIKVHVFSPLPAAAIKLQGAAVSLPTDAERNNTPYLEMVLNAPVSLPEIPVLDVANLELSLTGFGAPGTSWDFTVESGNENALTATKVSNDGTFELAAHCYGNITLTITLFPIGADGTQFAFPGYYAALQTTQTVTVEIRNIFLEKDLSGGSSLTFAQSGEPITNLNVFNAAANHDKVLENFRVGILKKDSTDELAATVVNSTFNKPRNNSIYFEVKEKIGMIEQNVLVGGQPVGVLDLFEVLYDVGGTKIPLNPTHVIPTSQNFRGIAYDNLFSISVINPAVFGRNLVLYAVSVQDSTIKVGISLTCIQAVGEIITDKILYPVIGGSDVVFTLETPENHIDTDFYVQGLAAGIFRVEPRPGNSATGAQTSLWELEIIDTALVSNNVVYTFDFVHKCGTRTTMSVIPLAKWTHDPTVEIRENSGDAIYHSEFQSSIDTLFAFVRVNGTFALDVTTAPFASFTGFEISEFAGGGGLQIIDLDNNPNRKLLRANEEGVYEFKVTVHAPDAQVINGHLTTFWVKVVVVNPIVSVNVDPGSIALISKWSLGYDQARGLTQAESEEIVNLVLGYASGYAAGENSVIDIDISFQGMDVTSPTNWASSVISITDLNNNKFNVQGLLSSKGSEIIVTFRVQQKYSRFGISVPIDFAVTGVSGGFNAVMRVTVTDAATVKTISKKDVGDILDVNLNVVGGVAEPTAVSVGVTTNPAAPYNNNGNGYLGWAFLNPAKDGLVFSVKDKLDGVTELASVDGRGVITAKNQNISSKTDIILVIYSLDSFDTRDVSAGVGLPGYFIQIPIFIYDSTTAHNQRTIGTIEQFIDAFYTKPGGAPATVADAKTGNLAARTNLGSASNSCYYQLIADINLSFSEGGVTKYYILPTIAHFGAESSAVFTGMRAYSLAGGEKNVNYKISNFMMTSDNFACSNANGSYNPGGSGMNFGFFGVIGTHGIVQGINFTDVRQSSNMSDGGAPTGTSVRFGVLAGINLGKVRDVTVAIAGTTDFRFMSTSQSNEPKQFDIGLLVGHNAAGAEIQETRYGQVRASGLFVFQLSSSQLDPVNFGGIVGLNNGDLIKEAGVAVLRESFDANSDAALVVLDVSASGLYSGSAAVYAFGPDYYVNVGGAAGKNTGTIDGYSSEAVIYNGAYGNTGGLVGFNTGGEVLHSYSNSAMYARSAVGGVVGRNLCGLVENCYYDLYLNEKVNSSLWRVLPHYATAVNYGTEKFFAGMIVGGDAGNSGIDTGYSGSLYYASPTVVGGVVGVNDSGDVRFSFAASAFSNEFTQPIDLLGGLHYKGDVFIYKAQNIVVGGVIGRQDNTSGDSEVLGCYSTLTVFFDAGAGGILASGAPVIGGIVGYLNDADAEISYCYSNMSISILNNTTGPLPSDRLNYGGYWAHGGGSGNGVDFRNCYSVYDTVKTVVGGTAMSDPIHTNSGPVNVTFANCAYVANVIGSAVSGPLGYTSAALMQSSGVLQTTHFTYIHPTLGGGFPVIFESAPANPIIMATPHDPILPHIKTQGEYDDTYRNARNNLGGFNYVIVNAGADRAALFYTSGPSTPTAVIANRYYFADLFYPGVDPEIAEKRVSYAVEGLPSVVQTGIEIGPLGARHYVDVKGIGSFDIVLTSTRFVNDGGNFTLAQGRIAFDVIDGIGQLSAYTGVAGLVGQKSILDGDKMNFTDGKFSVQKNTSFVINGQTDTNENLGWDVKIFAGKVTGVPDIIQNVSVNGGGFVPLDMAVSYGGGKITGITGTEYENLSSFAFNELGNMEFAVVPVMKFGGQDYYCYALAFTIKVTVYGGAIELRFDQSVNTGDSIQGQNVLGGSVIDPSAGTISRGVFTTDIQPDYWLGITDEEELLTLVKFYYVFENRVERLFWDNVNDCPAPDSSTTIHTVGGEHISIYFELAVDDIVSLGDDYYEYTFSIYIGIIVDADGSLYGNIADVTANLFSVTKDIKGKIAAEEILRSGNSAARELFSAYTNLDIIAQDLQQAEIQHFANSEKVKDENNKDTMNIRVDENQHASSSIYVGGDNGGGLLKVYAIPYFSNIDSFTIYHDKGDEFRNNSEKKWMQYVGMTPKKQGEVQQPIYEEWRIEFVQMVYDTDQKIFVQLPALLGNKYRQVSTVRSGADGGKVYSWTGVYYIQTLLFEPNTRYIGEGMGNSENIAGASVRIENGAFDIAAKFETNGNRLVEKIFTVHTADAPGLSFQYEGVWTRQAEQAVGTTVPFTVSAVPAEKTSILSYSIEQGEQDGKARIDDTNGYKLILEDTYDYSTDEPIIIRFFFEREEENGSITVGPDVYTDFVVTPVLFKVRGFGIDGAAGNTIRLTNSNRQNMNLNIVSTYAPGKQGEVFDARAELLRAINSGANRDWLVWTAGGARLNVNLGGDGYYANNAQVGAGPGEINFRMGEFGGLGTLSKFIVDAGFGAWSGTMDVEMIFAYENGVPVLKQNLGVGARRVISSFAVITINQTDEDNPIPIYQKDVNGLFRSMLRGSHYIIMEDLVLSDWVPMPFVAASLDGNSKKITINSFNFGTMPRDIGLFSTVGLDSNGGVLGGTCVLKNINIAMPNNKDSLDVDLSSSRYNVNSLGAADIYVGALAGRNGGVITNCAVVNQQQFKTQPLGGTLGNVSLVDYERPTPTYHTAQQSLKVMIGNSELDVRVGGLVGENTRQGVISNSRVMISIDAVGVTSETNAADKLNLAGFAAENYGIIVSCFYRDGDITNSVSAKTENLTSGFVGKNLTTTAGGNFTAKISGCYVLGVSGDYNNADGSKGTVKNGEISSPDDVAAFVMTNSGAIENCSVNTRIIDTSRASGFVMSNNSGGQSGSVKNCFVNNYKLSTSIVTYFGFAPVGAGGIFESCMFVIGGTTMRGFGGIEGGSSGISGISETKMQDVSTFFDLGFSIDEYVEGADVITIWKMKEYVDGIMAPGLVSANEIAESVRILEPQSTEQIRIYSYALHPIGSRKNPVLVTNGRQFDDIFTQSETKLRDDFGRIDFEKNIYDKHVRLVNNIDLRRESSGGDLDDTGVGIRTYQTVFSGQLDGNGLGINGISFNANDAVTDGLRSVGLFSKLEYASVKNVYLGFVQQVGSADSSIIAGGANYVGGLAGISINSNISDITLRGGANAVIQGRSIVGGLVGMAAVFDIPETNTTEEFICTSKIQNIKSGVPVKANLRAAEQYIDQFFLGADDYLDEYNYYDTSVAGGIIGMITCTPRADYWEKDIDRLNIDILRRDKNHTPRTDILPPAENSVHVRNIANFENSYNVSGEVIGGLVGVIDSGIVVENAELITTGAAAQGTQLSGKFFVGGIVGANFGTLENSTVNIAGNMVLQSIIPNVYVFRSHEIEVEGISIGFTNHHGMTVGGAVGFNSGTVDAVEVTANLNSANFGFVWKLGGLVGENKGNDAANSGKITNCKFTGAINGGMYIGGLVGVNVGTATSIQGNIVNVTTWGANFGGVINKLLSELPTDGFGYREQSHAIGAAVWIYPFFEKFAYFVLDGGTGKMVKVVPDVDRAWITGGYIGENRDAELTIMMLNTNNGYNTSPGNRMFGGFSVVIS